VARLKLDLTDAVTKRDSLKKDLTSVPAMLTVDHGPQVVIAGRLSPVDERLQELRRNLDGLLLKFTENHPDVKATRASIAQLQSEAGKSGGGTGSSAGNTGQIANGVYEQVKVRLVDAEAVIAALQRRLTAAENDQARVEKIAKAAPGILVQAQDLNRDYGILRRNYEELVARRESTAIANDERRTLDPDHPLFLQMTEQSGHGFTGRSDSLRHLFMGHDGAQELFYRVHNRWLAARQQQSCQLAGRGTGQHQIVNIAIGTLEFTAQRLSRMHTHFSLGLQQGHEILAADKIQLARRTSFGGHFVVGA
jgi:hypothetical protein